MLAEAGRHMGEGWLDNVRRKKDCKTGETDS